MKKKFIDSLFRNGLDSSKENMVPAEHDWTAMERRLDRRDRRRRIFFWLNTTTGVALLFTAAFFLWPASEKHHDNEKIIAASEKHPEDEKIIAEHNPAGQKGGTVQKQQDDWPVPAGVETAPHAGKIGERSSIHSDKQPGNIASETAPVLSRKKTQQSISPPVSGTPEKKRGVNPDASPSASQASENKQETNPDVSAETGAPAIETTITRPEEKKGDRPEHLQNNVSDKVSGDTASGSAKNIAADAEKEAYRNSPEKSGKNRQPDRKPKFYYGLVVGPDLSMIKSQGIKKIGYNVGLLAGYRFSDHWSAETGVIWAEKKYFTDGKYFHKYGAGIPSSVKLLSLDGGCAMFVLPLAARYNFSAGRQSFFATGGLVSYLMQKESYDYVAQTNSSTYKGYRSYKNSGNHLFAGLQFSAGYSYPLSRKLELRAEPYIHLPLKQMGIGKMPITSMGVQVGFMLK